MTTTASNSSNASPTVAVSSRYCSIVYPPDPALPNWRTSTLAGDRAAGGDDRHSRQVLGRGRARRGREQDTHRERAEVRAVTARARGESCS
ncbi:hypothetical protein M3148_01090 [Georgenia satyanarayanai]|uniref:hypothetical protein n=1 Tax=Georgenia satyanarayanai TaxID=860221 RepID=UPI00203D7758|nr:hypothetical protein [Georgenia satyanarayanai]MCM3659592.1 hypothetical protein [Georgenia satyanarayanai]